jgi:hypothetical protein
MSDISCDSRTSIFRRDRVAGAFAALVVAGALVACSRPPPPSAESLKLPLARAAGFGEIETRFVAGDDNEAHRGAAGPAVLAQLQRAGIHSAAEYLYVGGAATPGRIKVRVELFEDEPGAQANWKTRHRPEALAMTTPFDAGDQGWIYSDQMAGVRVGRLILEFRVKGKPPPLPAFARAYAEFARQELASERAVRK